MKQLRQLYESNRQAINDILISHGYRPTFEDMINAYEDLQGRFLVQVYNEVTSQYSDADGNFWPKFKAIFHKAIGIGGGVDNIINRDTQQTSDTSSDGPSKEELKKKNQKQLLYWGIGTLALIIILIIIYALKK